MNRNETELPFDFRDELRREGPIEVEGIEYSADTLIEKLRPLVEDKRWERIESVVQNRTWNLMTVTEQLYDIGNLSAVMRSAESFGFLPFTVLDRKGSEYKKSDRISKGSEKWLHIRHEHDTTDCVKSLQAKGYQVMATSLENSIPIQEVDFSKPTALVFGNERDGISKEMAAAADATIQIPMQGFTQSFNISVAAALCFQTAFNARNSALGNSGDMNDGEKMNLMAQYLMRSIGSPEKNAQILARS